MTKTDNKRAVPRVLFHIIIAIITDILLFGLAAILLIPTGILRNGLLILALIVFINSIVYASVSGYISRWSKQIDETLRIVGWGPGRLVGIFVGYIIGFSFGGIVWGICTAIIFYFLGRWTGSQLSARIGGYLEGIIQVEPASVKASSLTSSRNIKIMAAFFVSSPILFIISAYLMMYFGIEFSSYPKIMPLLRPIFIAYSLTITILPWFMWKRLLISYQANQQWQVKNPEFIVFLLGLVFLVSPSIFGLASFLMGNSFLELLIFCSVSIFAMSAWTIYKGPQVEVAG